MDLLDLTIADSGVTLDLDKDWHSDLYEKRNALRSGFFSIVVHYFIIKL